MSYIYKITNIVTNKEYKGYTSRNINRRFYEHKWEALNTSYEENKSYLYQSMRKYGTECFIIETVLEFDENKLDWKELEKYYIKKYKTLIPNGYNLLEGGDKPPIHYGDENNKTKIKDKDLLKLFQMLKDYTISYREISNYFNISISQLYDINQGKSRHQKDISYPIRKHSQQEEFALKVIQILKNDITLSNQKIADLIPNYFRANEIASINNGKKYAYLWNGDFPIRKVIVPNDYEKKQEIAYKILNYINNNKNLSQIKIIVFFPEDGVSTIQKLQMQSQEGNNTYVVSINGNFDDAQGAVKKIFNDEDFAKVLKDNNY